MESGELVLEKFYDENGEEIDPTFLDITDVSLTIHFLSTSLTFGIAKEFGLPISALIAGQE